MDRKRKGKIETINRTVNKFEWQTQCVARFNSTNIIWRSLMAAFVWVQVVDGYGRLLPFVIELSPLWNNSLKICTNALVSLMLLSFGLWSITRGRHMRNSVDCSAIPTTERNQILSYFFFSFSHYIFFLSWLILFFYCCYYCCCFLFLTYSPSDAHTKTHTHNYRHA